MIKQIYGILLRLGRAGRYAALDLRLGRATRYAALDIMLQILQKINGF